MARPSRPRSPSALVRSVMSRATAPGWPSVMITILPACSTTYIVPSVGRHETSTGCANEPSCVKVTTGSPSGPGVVVATGVAAGDADVVGVAAADVSADASVVVAAASDDGL